MIRPVRDSLVALILTLAGLAAFGYGLTRLWVFGPNDLAGGIAVAVGGLTAFLSGLMLVNFWRALRIARKMRRGEGVIGRWTAPVETITAYLAAEEARPVNDRSRWQPKPGKPAEIIVSADAVLAGGQYHGLSSQGVQIFVAVSLVYGTPLMIEFTNHEIAAGPSDRVVSGRSVLRLPVARGADQPAGQVLGHYRQVLSGAIRVKPGFWRQRLRIGLGAMLLGAAATGLGWVLAERGGWRVDDGLGMAALVLLISGPVLALGGLILAAIATVKKR